MCANCSLVTNGFTYDSSRSVYLYWGDISIDGSILSLQYSRNVSQTRWIIDDERMGEASVEVVHLVVIWICIY